MQANDNPRGKIRTEVTPERFLKTRALFEAALEVDPDERSNWLLRQVMGDAELSELVQDLLLADRLAGEGNTLTASLTVAKDETPFPVLDGRRIGHYEIVRQIGVGGMGAVYLAPRTDDVFSKPIAIKILRSERNYPDLLRRFRQERDIVATLDHPNIARLLDGGTTEEGLSYFVMEYARVSRSTITVTRTA